MLHFFEVGTAKKPCQNDDTSIRHVKIYSFLLLKAEKLHLSDKARLCVSHRQICPRSVLSRVFIFESLSSRPPNTEMLTRINNFSVNGLCQEVLSCGKTNSKKHCYSNVIRLSAFYTFYFSLDNVLAQNCFVKVN